MTVAADGTFQVTAGDNLPPGGTAEHAVVVTYAIDQSAITTAGWTALGTCATDLTQHQSGGLTNGVAMTGDSDGVGNNYACTPVSRPIFAVAKTTAQGPIALAAGQTSVTRTYQVTVSNPSQLDGISSAVLDTPNAPAGFTLMSATVDGSPVQITKGSFQVTPGDVLAGGASKAHTVIVTYAVDLGATIDWQALGTCGAPGGAADTGKGLTNVVTMDGDSDGPNDNWACTSVTPPPAPTKPGIPVDVQTPSAPVTPAAPTPTNPAAPVAPSNPLARTGAPDWEWALGGIGLIVAGAVVLGRRR